MAKVLNIAGQTITTDEDWYEIDAFGKRSGRRFLNGEDPNAAAGGGAVGGLGGGGRADGAGGPGIQFDALAGLQKSAGGSGGGGTGMPQQNVGSPSQANPFLGQRRPPIEGLVLPGRVY